MSAALIGGGRYGKGFVTINNGTVSTEVYSKYDSSYYLASFGAVIGGGYSGDAYVTSNGGKVTVNRRYADVSYGAGIGGGKFSPNTSINITGGQVIVNNKPMLSGNQPEDYSINGADIGGGQLSFADVTITGGNVVANDTSNGAAAGNGIGAGYQSNETNITLSWTNPTDSITS